MPSKQRTKDPAAVSLGRRGGLSGGLAKVATKGFGSLTPEQRREMARTASKARCDAVRKAAKKGKGK